MKNRTIEKSNEIVTSASGVLSIVNPFFSAIPLVTFVLKEIIVYNNPSDVEHRLKKLEKRLKNKKIDKEKFKTKVNKLSEHNKYIVKKHLKNILTICIPETVDVYIDILIDLIMKEKQDLSEEICEVVNELNKNDLELLKAIKSYFKNGKRNKYDEMIAKKQKSKVDYKKRLEEVAERENHGITKQYIKTHYVDRNRIYDEKTIFWKDFAEYNEINVSEVGVLLNVTGNYEDGTVALDFAYLARSLLKLARLGIIDIEFNTTLNTTSMNNLDRFHITIFGMELLEYI